MSSLPGLSLEAFLAWNYDLIVAGDGSANPSRLIAETLGTIEKRQELTTEKFAQLVALYEPYRDQVEWRLADFDAETQSWRDYAGYGFDFLPASLFDMGLKMLTYLLLMDEQVVISCAECKIPILTFWKPNGGLLRGEYVLVADWIYHPKCFDKVYEGAP
jgi:hypothetical protein